MDENVDKKDENKVFPAKITPESFWAFWNSDDQLNKIEDEGIGNIFIMFQYLEIPTFQDEYMDLKPHFIRAFRERDLDSKGWISKSDFILFVNRVCMYTLYLINPYI